MICRKNMQPSEITNNFDPAMSSYVLRFRSRSAIIIRRSAVQVRLSLPFFTQFSWSSKCALCLDKPSHSALLLLPLADRVESKNTSKYPCALLSRFGPFMAELRWLDAPVMHLQHLLTTTTTTNLGQLNAI
jgi:hypothetical protein